MNDEKDSFGATVRGLRKERGIGLRKFAQMVEMSPTYLSKVVRDEFKPPTEEKVELSPASLARTQMSCLLWLVVWRWI